MVRVATRWCVGIDEVYQVYSAVVVEVILAEVDSWVGFLYCALENVVGVLISLLNRIGDFEWSCNVELWSEDAIAVVVEVVTHATSAVSIRVG